MAASFFFYDLETSGFDPRNARIMQFGGQRTDLDLKPIGDPLNFLIKLTPDVLPSPDAIMITGITPQMTLREGYTEAEFLKLFYDQAVQPETIFVGYNNIRFDDEFMRFLLYRNFYDAYEWHWQNSCSRWDILDTVRMTRALRPDGIEWPFAPDGKPTNRLEFITALNKLEHPQAHQALSDVRATISVAKLIKEKQPDLFKYLLGMRDKQKVAGLVENGQPFVYTSGRYGSTYFHTTAAIRLAPHPQAGAALVYDLRDDPQPYLKMSVDELVSSWRPVDPAVQRLPVKTLKYNRCPAIAPLGVIQQKKVQERLQLNLTDIERNLAALRSGQTELADKILQAVAKLDEKRQNEQVDLIDNRLTVDSRLYDGFIGKNDKRVMNKIREAKPEEVNDLKSELSDSRLKNLLPLYKARNFPKSLSSEESAEWERFYLSKLTGGGAASLINKYFERISELAASKPALSQQYLLEELRFYGESLIPVD